MPGNGAEGRRGGSPPERRLPPHHQRQPAHAAAPPPSRAATGRPAPAVIVVGGDGYVVVDKEGSEIAAWLNAQGLAARAEIPRPQQPGRGAPGFATVAEPRALESGGVADRPEAGGHDGIFLRREFGGQGRRIARTASYPVVDAIDGQSCRPDFTMPAYPAYLDDKAGKVSPEIDLQADLPPTLIVHNDDDKTHVIGSKIYAAALAAAGKRHDLKLYPTGGHGYGLHSQGDAKAWPEDALKWLEKQGLAGK